MPNIVVCFIKKLLLGNGELLLFFFFCKDLESVLMLYILICTSSLACVVGLFVSL